jgi:hypothetical protein
MGAMATRKPSIDVDDVRVFNGGDMLDVMCHLAAPFGAEMCIPMVPHATISLVLGFKRVVVMVHGGTG